MFQKDDHLSQSTSVNSKLCPIVCNVIFRTESRKTFLKQALTKLKPLRNHRMQRTSSSCPTDNRCNWDPRPRAESRSLARSTLSTACAPQPTNDYFLGSRIRHRRRSRPSLSTPLARFRLSNSSGAAARETPSCSSASTPSRSNKENLTWHTKKPVTLKNACPNLARTSAAASAQAGVTSSKKPLQATIR